MRTITSMIKALTKAYNKPVSINIEYWNYKSGVGKITKHYHLYIQKTFCKQISTYKNLCSIVDKLILMKEKK